MNATIRGATGVFLFLVLPSSLYATSMTMTTSQPNNDGDETITVRYKDSEGQTKSFSAPTGEFGSNNTSDDIKKTHTPETKAQTIATAINSAPENGANVSAIATGSSVTVSVTGDNQRILSFKKTNNTREPTNRLALDTGENTHVAYVRMIGGPTGLDDDSFPAQVMIGTDRGQVTLSTADYNTLDDLVEALVDALVLEGIAANQQCSTVIKITMSPLRDAQLHYGNTDVGIDQEAQVATRTAGI